MESTIPTVQSALVNPPAATGISVTVIAMCAAGVALLSLGARIVRA